MAKNNYSRDKQQKDLAKKKKREEKLQRKTTKGDGSAGDAELGTPDGELGEASDLNGTPEHSDSSTDGQQ